MKFTSATVLAVAAGASANYNGTSTQASRTVTPAPFLIKEVVTEFVTYCPEPTSIVFNNKTIHVATPGTVTITDCPCTISRKVIPTPIVICHNCTHPTQVPCEGPECPAPAPEPTVVPCAGPECPAPAPPCNGNDCPAPAPGPGGKTVPAPTGTGVPQAPHKSQVPTAGAAKAVLSGAGLAGVVGIAAFIL